MRPTTVMGILNVTPDSFSDGGLTLDAGRAIEAGHAMAADGADIIDVGGESTRPGAHDVPPDVECGRIIPVIRALALAGHRVSVDTRNAATMQAALDVGASIVNDVSALTYDPWAAATVARAGCEVILMHMRGTPATMAQHTTYADVAAEVAAELCARAAAALDAGIARDRITLDPGFGFAKTPAHSVALLKNLSHICNLGYPVAVGLSRKGFIGHLSGVKNASDRLAGSLAGMLFAASYGVAMLRVHDVAAAVQALRIWRALAGTGQEAP